jgi:hypothetical protein
MSDHHQQATVDAGDPVGEILETFRAPTGPAAMSRARRLARAAHAALVSLREVALTAITVDGSESGGYVVEVRVVSRLDAPRDLGRAIAQRVREAADDRGLGPYLEDVAIVVEGVRP